MSPGDLPSEPIVHLAPSSHMIRSIGGLLCVSLSEMKAERLLTGSTQGYLWRYARCQLFNLVREAI